MNKSLPLLRRLDIDTLEMIVVIAILSLHDFLLSDALSIPFALQHSELAQLRALDRVMSSLEFVVPVVVILGIIALWLIGRNIWARRVTIAYLVWVTLRLIAKVALVLLTIVSPTPKSVVNLLKDMTVLWFVNVLLFGVWYWIIDGGGPRARRDGTARRFDLGFPQRMTSVPGWEGWRPGFWDYVALGFSGSTQFGLGDTSALSLRSKLLLMLQATLSILVIVFIASIALGLVRQ